MTTDDKRFRPLGQGVPIDAIGASRWADEGYHQGWRPLNENDLFEFMRAPSAKYVIREYEPGDVVTDRHRHWYRGARQLVIVFRSGHQFGRYAPGWLELDRAIEEAERYIAACPALAADASPDATPRKLGLGKREAADPRRVSPLVSGYVYVDAPGGMSLCWWGARIHKDFDPMQMTIVSRYTVALYQRLVDKRTRFERDRLAHYDIPLPIPIEVLRAPPRRKRSKSAQRNGSA